MTKREPSYSAQKRERERVSVCLCVSERNECMWTSFGTKRKSRRLTKMGRRNVHRRGCMENIEKKEELLYLTFVFSVQHAEQSKMKRFFDPPFRSIQNKKRWPKENKRKPLSDLFARFLQLKTRFQRHGKQKTGQLNVLFCNNLNMRERNDNGRRKEKSRERENTILSIRRKS